MTKSENQYKLKISDFPDRLLPFEDGKPTDNELLTLKTRISEAKDIICELGFGSGMHLLELAERNPDTLHVGFELRYKRTYRCAEKSISRGINNILLVRTFAQDLFPFFEPQSISGVYINFPDPWDKPRWAKHRLVTNEYLTKLLQMLKSDGFFSFKTDHPGYFNEVVKLLGEIPNYKVVESSLDLHKSEFSDKNILTEFESLFKSKGLPVHYLLAIKASNKDMQLR